MNIAQLELGGAPSRVSLVAPEEALRWYAPGGEPRAFEAVIVDENTARLLPGKSPAEPGVPPRLVVPAGEACKDLAVLNYLLQEFARLGLRRDSVIAALGGGAVTDLAAFAASIYLRGIEVVLIPSSLLAMVDAAVGGKTGIDLEGYKNMVGTFYPAREVRLVPELLQTLSEREYRSGLAEVIKAALLDDPELLKILEDEAPAVCARDESLLSEIIRRAVLVKCRVVAEDFTEQGRRAHLNLGHTFGHALEACLGLGVWTHGEAVAWGIARAMDLGRAEGLTDPAWARRVESILDRYGYPWKERPARAENIIEAMAQDKKRRHDGVYFIVQTGPFTTVQHPVPLERVRSLLE
ncbi:3-dehydroquinate synthase [Alkalispirochaeta sphaeroplastigenens]|uniref:3-dehydroquinate synthase n=1 Tax=Alkalispirochaeta sphaeroplastigenens TaxID=1187066 RepID=A0A2S4JQR3_9SPIO|nr:3-dehydroquinate synthase family protein [Alkalispirochaeta sphaeroplastigenens]POR01813.1 3-dehydroquinate synthase [Alkalispirochaeta sphaeroplastigenens]